MMIFNLFNFPCDSTVMLPSRIMKHPHAPIARPTSILDKKNSAASWRCRGTIYFVSPWEWCYFLPFFLDSIWRVNLASAILSRNSWRLERILENFSKYFASISPSWTRVLDNADAAAS